MYRFLSALLLLCASFALRADGLDDLDNLRRQADAARSAHDTATAIQLYEKALQLDAQWAEGWWYLGNMYYVSGQFAKSRATFHQLRGLAPQLAEAWGMEGLAAMQAGDYSEALSLLDKSLALQFDLQPTIRDTLLTNRAFLLSHEGNFEDAIEALSAYVHGVPDPALLKALGIAALRRRWLPSEIPAADSDLITAAGRVEFALLASDPAVQQLAAALATQFPDVIGVHYLVGFVMFQQNTPRAEREFRQELAIDPGDLAACSMLAYSLIVEHRDLSSAQTLARRAVDAEPKNAGFQYVLGRVLDAQGAYEEAVPVLEAAVKLKPDNVEYHIELAVACAAAGRAQQAVEERRRALELKFGHAG